MRKPNPIDAVFKNKVKFDTQRPIIGTLLTQSEPGKLNQEKTYKKKVRECSLYKRFENCRAIKRIQRF